MTNVEIHKDVFNDTYHPHLRNYSREQIFYGGSGSGKSRFLAQRTVVDVLTGGRNYIVCRKVARTLRGSVFTEISRVISEWGLMSLFSINKTDMLITCNNGYQIIFAGLDDMEKLKSITPAKGVITDVWIEEATEVERDDVKQLKKRQRGGSEDTPKRITMSFNPILKTHWIYQDYFAAVGWTDEQTTHTSDNLSILKTWYVHNRWLTADDVADLTSETDSYYHSVYTLGNWGVLGNVIFTNVTIADLLDETSDYYLPEAQRTNRKHGLDFGFSSDPAAMPSTHYDRKRKRIYFYDELYERGLTNDLLADEIKKHIGYTQQIEDYDTDGLMHTQRVNNTNDRIVADSAEPKSIAELRKHGINIVSARKGKDSVTHGVQWLQQQELVIDKRCVNTINEFTTYHWKEDKDGNAIKEPVDKNNHLIDGTRYAYEDESQAVEVQVIDNPFF